MPERMSDERLAQLSIAGLSPFPFDHPATQIVQDAFAELLEEVKRARRVEDTIYAAPPRPWPRAQRMPLAMAGGRVQPWHMQALAEYDEARGGITEANSSPAMYTAAQVNRAIAWWNERAESDRGGN